MNKTDAEIKVAVESDIDKGFRMLVSKYAQPVYRHVRRMVISHHDAEDVTQETFLRAFRSLDSLQSAETLKGWIYRIATNESLRLLEKRKADLMPLENVFDALSDNYVDYDDLESVRLKRAVAALPPKQQAVFNLRYYDELDYSEIASVMETSVGGVRANYHNAKERIIKYMNSISWDYEN